MTNCVADYSLLLYVLQEFIRRGFTEILIVYDYDDLLWPLMKRVCARLGINHRRATQVFRIYDNHLLTRAEQEAIIAAFAEPSFFQDIQFYPGIEDITRVVELGAKLEINSNSFNQPIADLKTEQLLAAVPNLRPEQIRMNIINHSTSDRKPLQPQTTIFYDDGPHNILLSEAILNGVPSKMLWSNHPSVVAQYRQQHKYVRSCHDLQEMTQLAYDVTEFLVKEGKVYA